MDLNFFSIICWNDLSPVYRLDSFEKDLHHIVYSWIELLSNSMDRNIRAAFDQNNGQANRLLKLDEELQNFRREKMPQLDKEIQRLKETSSPNSNMGGIISLFQELYRIGDACIHATYQATFHDLGIRLLYQSHLAGMIYILTKSCPSFCGSEECGTWRKEATEKINKTLLVVIFPWKREEFVNCIYDKWVNTIQGKQTLNKGGTELLSRFDAFIANEFIQMLDQKVPQFSSSTYVEEETNDLGEKYVDEQLDYLFSIE